ncbi:MAG TPA: hypothetical protein VK897_14675 [Anaerolineales bacterium]|nr:hypothetical protein [Anaerolineales bacterium]
MNQEQHEMILEKTHPSGVDEWYCPTCGRRFLMQWPPAYKKIVLEPGDEDATHNGSKVDLPIESVEMTLAEEDQISDDSLRIWQKALDQIDMDDVGDEKAA